MAKHLDAWDAVYVARSVEMAQGASGIGWSEDVSQNDALGFCASPFLFPVCTQKAYEAVV